MAVLNRGTIVTEVENVIDRSDLTTQIQTYIDWAQKRITRAHPWQELYNFDKTSLDTVTDTETVSISSMTPSVRVILSLILEDGASSRKLVKVLPRHWDKILSDPSQYASARSSWYTKKGSSLYLHPIPDAVYDLWISFLAWPALLTTDGATPDLTDKDDLIVTTTALEAAYAISDDADIKMWEGRYKRLLGEAIMSDMDDPDWSPIARGFNSGGGAYNIGEYWANPFVNEVS